MCVFRKHASDLPEVAVKRRQKIPRPKQLNVSLTSYFYRKKLRPEQLTISLMSYFEGEKLRPKQLS